MTKARLKSARKDFPVRCWVWNNARLQDSCWLAACVTSIALRVSALCRRLQGLQRAGPPALRWPVERPEPVRLACHLNHQRPAAPRELPWSEDPAGSTKNRRLRHPVPAGRLRLSIPARTLVGPDILGSSSGRTFQTCAAILTESAGQIIFVAALGAFDALHSLGDFAGLEGSDVCLLRGLRCLACGRALLLGGLLVTVAPVVGDIKSAALENQSRAGSKQSPNFSLAPFFHPAMGLRANGQRSVLHRLKDLESLPAFLTFVFVGWHRAGRIIGNSTNLCNADPVALDVFAKHALLTRP